MSGEGSVVGWYGVVETVFLVEHREGFVMDSATGGEEGSVWEYLAVSSSLKVCGLIQVTYFSSFQLAF